MIGREEFFDRYWVSLEEEGWNAIILHSWKDLPAKIESDIDYAVAGCEPRELLDFLERFARKYGWKLVQVIEHEPSAYFCVCMQDGGEFQQIALDVTWDYRRLGHHLIGSELLQKGARAVSGKSFRVPSPGAEAVYILAKAAAKDKKFEEVEVRLKELCREDPEGFLEVLGEALGFRCDKKSEADISMNLKEWYNRAPIFKPVRSGKRYGLSEIGLYLRRCFRPTGVWLGFPVCDSEIEKQCIEDALKPIRPLYRRSKDVGPVSLLTIPKVLCFIIRTSLLVEMGARKSMAGLFRETVEDGAPKDPAKITRAILTRLNNRITKRIV